MSRLPKASNSHEHPNGKLYQGNSIDWLASLDDASIDLVFADPLYNIKKADWDSFESQEHTIAWSIQWISHASRVLKPTGSLYVCGFSEILADLKHPASKYFKHCRWLRFGITRTRRIWAAIGGVLMRASSISANPM